MIAGQCLDDADAAAADDDDDGILRVLAMSPSAARSETLQTSVLILNSYTHSTCGHSTEKHLLSIFTIDKRLSHQTISASAEGVFTGCLKCLLDVQLDQFCTRNQLKKYRNGQILHSQC